MCFNWESTIYLQFCLAGFKHIPVEGKFRSEALTMQRSLFRVFKLATEEHSSCDKLLLGFPSHNETSECQEISESKDTLNT